MSAFDEVLIFCECGGIVPFQTHYGPCEMRQYTVDSAPPSMLGSIIGEISTCRQCGKKIKLYGNVVIGHLYFGVVGMVQSRNRLEVL